MVWDLFDEFSAWKFPPQFLGVETPGYGCQLVDNDNYRDWKREASSVTLLQGGPLPVINGVIIPINGLIIG